MSGELKIFELGKEWCVNKKNFVNTRLGTFLIFFTVSLIISSAVLYVLNPIFLQTKGGDGNATGDVSMVKLFITSSIIGIIFGFIGYMVKSNC